MARPKNETVPAEATPDVPLIGGTEAPEVAPAVSIPAGFQWLEDAHQGYVPKSVRRTVKGSYRTDY